MNFWEILFHPFIIPPLSFGALAFIMPKSKFTAILNIILETIFIIVLFLILPWPNYGSYYLRYLYILLLIISAIKPIKRIKKLPWKVNNKKIKLVSFLKICTITFLSFFINWTIQATRIKNKYFTVDIVHLEFPLKKGTYYISHGGTTGILNYHQYLAWQEYAIDIEKLNCWGRSWKKSFLKPREIELYNIFMDTVYSPCNGIVTSVIDFYPDHSTGNLNEFKSTANKIIIHTPDSCYIELYHLQNNSAMVKINDTVNTNQPLARIGNSGKSTHPHLHINAYTLNKISNIPISRQIFFNGFLPTRNDIIKRK